MKLFDRMFRKDKVPIVVGPYGITTEWAREQAAMNMKLDPWIKAQVEALLCNQLGSREAGMAEARRRFPEAYDER